MQNQMIEEQVLGTLTIAQEAAGQLKELANSDTLMQFLRISTDLGRMLNGLKNILEAEKKFRRSAVYLNNALASLRNLQWLVKNQNPNCFMKIEFELIPLIEEVYYEFYIAFKIMGDEDREYRFFFEECPSFVGNQHINKYLKTGEYPYEVSISVIAYNHLDYTKMCIDSILKYMPKNLNYELILVNHGSNDGTKEYFESIGPTKQIDLAENLPGTNLSNKVIEGKYWCHISNDIIVTKNYLENMMQCFKSDASIAEVVPTTPNVSNLQTIKSKFENLNEMFLWAEKNNISDSFRWEQRTRLCNPIGLVKSECAIGSGDFYKVRLLNEHLAFPDDGMAALRRRSGRKMMLLKDTFCYHFGSVTIGRGESTSASYSEGKRIFQKYFSIDPWNKGFCYDDILISKIRLEENSAVNILGINCGIGSNPLKIREALKENVHNRNAQIYNATAEYCYLEDLKGVSDVAVYFKNFSNFNDLFPNIKFAYIIVEGLEGITNIKKFQKYLMCRLEKRGQLVILDYLKDANMSIDSRNYKTKKWGYFILQENII